MLFSGYCTGFAYCQCLLSKGARSFRSQKSSSQVTGCTFFPQKKVTTFLVVAVKTRAANAADCFTVKIKQIKRSDMVREAKQ